MADTLLIHYSPSNSPSSIWALANDAGELTCKITQGELSEAAEMAKQHKVVVLLDNSLLHLNTVDLPTQNPQKILRAIPFALEEQIADDIDDMHFVAAKAVKDRPTPVIGINKNNLDAILTDFEQAGITADAMIPDCLCLAATVTQWCCLFHQDQVDIQTSELGGHEYDAELFETIIKLELDKEDNERPEKILLFTMDGDDSPVPSIQVHDDIEIIHVTYNTHPIVIYAGSYKQALPLNLLQHEYKPQKSGGISWRRWRLAASLGIVWLVLSLGITAFQLQELKTKNSELQTNIVRTYKQAFPKSKKIVNPRVQMEQKLNELKSGGGGANDSMLALIAQSAKAIATDSSLELRTITFRNNRLDLSFNSKNLKSLQDLNTRLNQTPGVSSEIISSSSEKNTVKGSLRIQRKAA